MNSRKLIAVALAAISCSTAALAGDITVDGNLADWGVTPGSDWTPNAGIYSTVEDYILGSNSNGYLGPGYGGQKYDAEAIYTTILNNRLFIALVTGHDPKTKQNPAGNTYGAGDFAIDFGKNGSYEVGINIVHAGDNALADTQTLLGGVYQVTQWQFSNLWNASGYDQGHNTSPITPYKTSDHPTYIVSGGYLGTAEINISGNQGSDADPHFVYEMSLDLKWLRSAGWNNQSFNIHWTENCANDSIIVDPPAYVPEPGTLTLMGLGLAGLAGMRRRQRT